MFKFLKDKIKDVVGKFSKKVDEEIEEEVREELKEKKEVKEEIKEVEEKEEVEKEKEKVEIEKVEEKKEEVVEEKETVEEKKEEVVEEKETVEEKVVEKEKEIEEVYKEETKEEPKPEKKGFFGRIKESFAKKSISLEKFEKLFWDIEVALMENNVAMEVIDKIKDDLKEELVMKKVALGKSYEVIKETLDNSIKSLFKVEGIDLLKRAKQKKPLVICFIGVNGSGKTTSIAKLAKRLWDNNLSCVLAASDTFRAASQEQLQIHANRLGIKMIKHDYGADPAAVAFDAIEHAKAKDKDVVLIDTAGRSHSNINLMDELRKVIKVAKPDLKIFVGDSLTGNDCVEQAKSFDKAAGIDGIILTKTDVDEKGGAALSISYITKKPILFLGVGQEYEDLKEFDPEIILENLGL